MSNMRSFKHILFISFWFIACACSALENDVMIGAIYFDGWAGHNKCQEEWAKEAPTHLTKKMKEQYSNREPIWGWRDDDLQIMEQQIDIAYKNGIDFFLFCWYYADDNMAFNRKNIESFPENTSLNLFLKAKNHNKMKFAIMIANHSGFSIIGGDNWIKTIDYLYDNYFEDSSYLMVEGKPFVMVFNSKEVKDEITAIEKHLLKKTYNHLYFVSSWLVDDSFDATSCYNLREEEIGVSEEREYKELIAHAESEWNNLSVKKNFIPLVMSGWDQRPWREPEEHLYYTNRRPELFFQHLSNAIELSKKQVKCPKKMVLIYAWNELGEGGYIIPTKGDKKGKYLQMIKQVKKMTE